MNRYILIALVAVVSLGAQPVPDSMKLGFQAQQGGREDADYRAGRQALDSSRWEEAIAAFGRSADRKGQVADAALYWKAYAQNRAGRKNDALATIGVLRQSYASSRWVNDARALELEIRGQAGTPVSPASVPDEDLKVIALNSLMQSDPEKAFPILEKLIKSGTSSTKIKEKALFVLTQSPSPQAQKLIGDIARGTQDPDLQRRAIRYIGMMGSEESRKQLSFIYASSTDQDVKRAILKSFMQSGSNDFLLNAAKTEKDPELRRQAIRQLAMTGGADQLWQLYGSSTSTDDKEEILKAMFMTGNSARLAEIARTENDPRLRSAAIKSLGLMGGNGRPEVLVSVFKSSQDAQVRKAVLDALFIQNNAKALVELARAESNPEMKRKIVEKLAIMHSEDAKEYMMELLK